MKIEFTDYSVEFASSAGGFPSKISQLLRNGRIGDVVHTPSPWLTVKLSGGRTAVPFLSEADSPLCRRDADGTAHIQFCGIGFTADGAILPDWRLNLDYELFADGNGFITAAFDTASGSQPGIDSFLLRIPMDFGTEDDVTYSFWPRPTVVDPTAISAVGDFVRFRNLTEKKERTIDWIPPLVGFDFGRRSRPSRHIEWLMEDQMSPDGDFFNVSTRLLWEGSSSEAFSPVIEYEFAAKPVFSGEKPYIWNEIIGFNLGQTPKVRDKAPLRFYHCIDAFENIPTIDRVRQMAAEGADVLALHDACWRSDIRNGGNPYVQQEFIDLIAECHRHDIRVAPYFRGSEEVSRDDACSWFDYYLKKDYDGLYSDYGAAFGFHDVSDAYPAGRIGFKEHYLVYKTIRERTVGKGGILDVHTGPFLSSAVISSLVDGYLSGEGERGAMLRSRRDNAYFSAATVSPGALWTAEFPEYRSEKMLPFLTNLGQFPHVIIGEQRKSASVAHPMEPQNVTFARPLWKLYGLMKDERSLRFDNDLCDESIECDSYDTGLSVFTMQDGSKLYLLCNFSDKKRLCSSNQILTLSDGQKCCRLEVNYEQCRSIGLDAENRVEAELKENGICGFLVYTVNEKWAERLAEFEKPYPELAPAAKAYEERLRDAVKQRFTASPVEKLFMKVDAPYYPGALEIQFLQECYENTNELFATDENGKTRRLGYLSKLGLTEQEPPISECLWPGQETDWIPLHEYLEKGKYHLEVHCTYGGYSTTQRYHILLSETCDPACARDVTFYLALDADKSRLSFDVERG